MLGQLLVSFDLMSYDNILLFTLILTAIALLTSLFLPMPQGSMFFHHTHTEKDGTRRNENGAVDASEHTSRSNISLEGTGDENREERGERQGDTGNGQVENRPKAEDLKESVTEASCGQVLLQLWRDFRQCYSSRQLLYWSVWWAMATCGYNQTVNYVQVSQ